MSESWLERRENQVAVVAETLAGTPEAIVREIGHDLMYNPKKVAQTTAISAVIGYGSTILMRRAPLLATLAAGGALLAETIRVGPSAAKFLSDAADAETAEQRSALARMGSLALGKEGATIVEGLPGAMAGGGLGMLHLNRSAAARELSFQVAQKFEFGLRRKVPEGLRWTGPGTKLKNGLVSESGTLDAIEASRIIPRQTSFSVERARIIDPLRGRVTRTASGVPDAVEVGLALKPHQVSVHTHNPLKRSLLPGKNSALKDGILPSADDMLAVPKGSLGIVDAGERSAFYIGQRTSGIKSTSGLADMDVKMVLVDHQKRLAAMHSYKGVWDAGKSEWKSLGNPVRLDYDDAISALRRVDVHDPWKTLSGIARFDSSKTMTSALAENSLVRPPMTRFARYTAAAREFAPLAAKVGILSTNPLNAAALDSSSDTILERR